MKEISKSQIDVKESCSCGCEHEHSHSHSAHHKGNEKSYSQNKCDCGCGGTVSDHVENVVSDKTTRNSKDKEDAPNPDDDDGESHHIHGHEHLAHEDHDHAHSEHEHNYEHNHEHNHEEECHDECCSHEHNHEHHHHHHEDECHDECCSHEHHHHEHLSEHGACCAHDHHDHDHSGGHCGCGCESANDISFDEIGTCTCGSCSTEASSSESKKILIKFFIALAFAIVGFAIDFPILVLVGYFITGYEVLISAVKDIFKEHILSENFLMGIATIGAIALGKFDEAFAVMALYTIGEFLSALSVEKSKNSIKSLMDLRPDVARVEVNGEWKEISPYDVEIGDKIQVKPGEKVALDGVVIKGQGNVDTMALTGEALPEEKSLGDSVLSGSIVLDSVLEIEVNKEFGDSTVTKIIRAVEEGAKSKGKSEKFITAFAKVYTPIVVVLALILCFIPPIFVGFDTFSQWLYRALIFLVISCPCALVISIPLTFFSGVGNCSKKGVLVKGNNYMEKLAKIDTLVMDKTGTLTHGKFQVDKVFGKNGEQLEAGAEENELLKLAYTCEHSSNHPVAKGVCQYADKVLGGLNIDTIEKVTEVHGKGMEVIVNSVKLLAGNEKLLTDNNVKIPAIINDKTNNTVIYFAENGVFAGAISLEDKIKDTTKSALEKIKKQGVKRIVMLTGDKEEKAKEVASKLPIDQYYSSLLPEDKVTYFKEEKAKANDKEIVAYIGDGINDAPTLALSDIGISMGQVGSDIAIEAGNVVLINDDLSALNNAIDTAKFTKKVAMENIIFCLLIKFSIMALDVFGFANMWLAIFADVGVTLLAVLNSTRALRYKAK